MRLAARERVGFEASEVRHVLRDERTLLGERGREDLLVGDTLEPAMVGVVNGDDVVSTCPKLFRDDRRIHLVEQEPHLSRRRSRSSVCSESLGLLVDHADPAVDLVRELGVVAHRDPNPLGRHAHALRERCDQLVALLRRRTSRRHDLPHVGPADDDRAAAGGAVAEDDPRVAVEPHPLVDVALREPHDRLAGLVAALSKSVQRLGPDSDRLTTHVEKCRAATCPPVSRGGER